MLALHSDAAIAGILNLPTSLVSLARHQVKQAADSKRALHRRTMLGRCDMSHNGKSRAVVQVMPVCEGGLSVCEAAMCC